MDNRRLLLLFVFSFSVFVLWDAWQKYNQPPAPPVTEAAVAAPGSAQVPGAPAATTAAVGSASVPTVQTAGKGETIRVATDLFVAEVSTQGGDIVGLELNNYKSLKNKEEKFKLFENKHQYVAQSGLIGDGLPNHKTLFAAKAGARELAAARGYLPRLCAGDETARSNPPPPCAAPAKCRAQGGPAGAPAGRQAKSRLLLKHVQTEQCHIRQLHPAYKTTGPTAPWPAMPRW